MVKLLIYIYTCKQYEESRALILENTWANPSSKDIVFHTDHTNSSLKNKIYLGDYTAGHTYHPDMVLRIFKHFLTLDYDFFMIVDDDTYVFVDRLKNYLSFFDASKPYMIGDFLNWPELRPNVANTGCNYTHWLGGGAGIVLTKSCIQEFLTLHEKHNLPYANHDVWLHNLYNVSEFKIRRVHCPAAHQYGDISLIKSNHNLISVHLNHRLEYAQHFHKIERTQN